ncbi:MAG: hypothetical protein WCK46_01510 [Candidatus Adlerbacteria bacterium]
MPSQEKEPLPTAPTSPETPTEIVTLQKALGAIRDKDAQEITEEKVRGPLFADLVEAARVLAQQDSLFAEVYGQTVVKHLQHGTKMDKIIEEAFKDYQRKSK